jgi:hypothetical protein
VTLITTLVEKVPRTDDRDAKYVLLLFANIVVGGRVGVGNQDYMNGKK